MMSILLYYYKELTKCINEVEQIEARVNNNHGRRRLTVNKEKEEEKSKALNQAIHTQVEVAAVPKQEKNSKKTPIKR